MEFNAGNPEAYPSSERQLPPPIAVKTAEAPALTSEEQQRHRNWQQAIADEDFDTASQIANLDS